MLREGGAAMHIASGVRGSGVARAAEAAVVDGDRVLTHAQLDDRSNRLAQHLLSAGLRPGERVAVVLGNRLEYCEIAAGLAKAGLVMVPVNPRLTAAEAGHILAHSGARGVIADSACAGLVAEAPPSVRLSIGGGDAGPPYEVALAQAGAADPVIPVAETDPFCVAYTSGTTGRPRGVLISHRSRCLTFLATALEWGLGPGRRTIAVAPMYHGAGFAFAYAAVYTGGTVVMLPAFDPHRLLEMVARHRPHSVFLVPTHAQLLRGLGEETLARADTAGLKTLYFNAAPLPQALKTWVLDSLPQVGLHELYGSTEAGIISNLRPQDQRRKVACVGPPWFSTEVRIVDADGAEVPPGVAGELYSRSPYLMNGYLDDPEATAACTTEDGFLTCGDVVTRDHEGYLYVVDRVKDMVITGGSNVYPREIEEVLCTHPEVADAAVVGMPDALWGEAVTAVVVPRDRAAGIDVDALTRHCRASLAGFKVPRRWHVREGLPRSPAGKVLKTEIRASLAQAPGMEALP